MKKRLRVWLLMAAAMFTVACDTEDLSPSGSCVEGIIPNDTAYKILYNACYEDLLWVEVKNHGELGRDIEIYTPSSMLFPNQPIKYSNVLEMPVPDFWKASNRRDTLMGKRIHFNYRAATEAESIRARHGECGEVYLTHNTELVVITGLSFERCSAVSENNSINSSKNF